MIMTALKGGGGKTKLELIAKPFLTAREQPMLIILEQLLPGYRIHAQVAMGALLKVKARSGQKGTPSDRNAVSQRIVDFVVQGRSTGHVIALIEVDDLMHRADADARRDAMTARAGYRTIRIAAGADSTDRRNTIHIAVREELVEGFAGVFQPSVLRGLVLIA